MTIPRKEMPIEEWKKCQYLGLNCCIHKSSHDTVMTKILRTKLNIEEERDVKVSPNHDIF